ncbi:MAG: hypothetical protein ACRCY8_14025 [Dermatophilaceae bacterium]
MRHLIRMLGVMLAMVGLVGALGASATAAPTEAAAALPAASAAPAVSTAADPSTPVDLVPAPSYAVKKDGVTIIPLVTTEEMRQIMAGYKIQLKWWGARVLFSRAETGKIDDSTKACSATIAALAIPVVGQALAAGCGALTVTAWSAVQQRKCLTADARIVFPTGVRPWIATCEQ